MNTFFLSICSIVRLPPCATLRTLHLFLVEGSGLGQEGFSLGGLATEGAESLDAEGLAGLGASLGPLVLQSPGVRLLGHNLSGLVAHQVRLLEATGGFFMVAFFILFFMDFAMFLVESREVDTKGTNR